MARFSRFHRMARLAAIAFSVGLSACQLPSPIPSGYVHHSKLYKSPPAAAPESIGIPWTPARNEEAATHWRVAAADMAGRIAADLPEKRLHILPSPADDPLSAVFENYLSEALQAKGFHLEPQRGVGYPDLTWDMAIFSDNPALARHVIEKRPVAARTPSPATQAPVGAAPVVAVETVPQGPLDVPPQTLLPSVPPKKPADPQFRDGAGRVAIRADLREKGRTVQSWGGVYPVSEIDSYRRPFPRPFAFRPVVGERPEGGAVPAMEVSR